MNQFSNQKNIFNRFRLACFILRVLLFAGLIILLIYGIMLLPGVQNKLRAVILTQLQQQLPGQITIESVRTDARLRFKILGIQWTNNPPANDTLLTCETLTMQMHPFRVMRKEFPFTHIYASRFFVDSHIQNLFISNTVSKSSKVQKASKSWTMKKCLFQVSDGAVLWGNANGSMKVRIGQANGWLQLAHSQPLTGELNLNDLGLVQDSTSVSLGQLACSFSREGDGFEGQVSLTHEKTQLTAHAILDQNLILDSQWQFQDDWHVLPAFLSLNHRLIDRLSGKGWFRGPIDSLQARAVFYPMAASSLAPDSILMSGFLSYRQFCDISMHIPWIDGNITFKGNLGLDSSVVSTCTLSVDRLSLIPLWQGVRQTESPFTGLFSGQLSGYGPGINIRQWTGFGHLSLTEMTYLRDPGAPMHASLKFSPDSIHGFAEQGITQVSGHLQLRPAGPKGAFRIKNIRTGLLAPWVNMAGIQGHLHGSGAVEGMWGNLIGRIHLESENLSYHFMSIDTLSISAAYENKVLMFKKTHLFAYANDSSQGQNSLHKFHGNLTMQANVSGPVNDLRGDLNINGEVNDWAGFHADTLSIQAKMLRGGKVSAMALIHADSSQTELTSQIGISPLEGRLETFMSHLQDSTSGVLIVNIDTTHGLRIRTLDSGLPLILFSSYYHSMPSIEGRMSLRGNFNPFSRQPIGSIHFKCIGLPFSVTNQGVLSGHLEYTREAAYFSTSVSCMDDSLRLDGNFLQSDPLDVKAYPSIQARLEGRVNNLSPYIQRWAPHISIQGVLFTRLEINGTFNDPKIYGNMILRNGEIELEDRSRFAESLDLTTHFLGDSVDAHLDGKIHAQQFQLRGKTAQFLKSSRVWQVYWQSDSSKLNLTGRMGEQGWEGNFEAKNFQLNHFQPLFPTLSGLNGQLNAAFSFQPKINGLLEQGFIDLQDITFSLTEMPVAVSKGYLHLGLNAQTIHFDSLSVQVNGGSYFGVGEYTHQGFQLFAGKMRLVGGRSLFKKPHVYQIPLDSLDVTMASGGMKNQLSGFVTLGESKFKQSVRVRDVLAWMDRTKQPWKKPSDFQKNTQLNLRIRNSKPFWIDNNLARLKLNSGMAIYGSLASPYFMGNVMVKEGYVMYLDRKFEVTQGELAYTIPESVYPDIKFSGKKIFKSYETFSGTQYNISLNLSGPVNRVRTQWQSEPSLTEADILALLTLGATRRELTKEDSERWGTNLTDILQDRLALISSQQVSAYTTKTLGNMFGLESMAVEGNLFKFGKSWGPQLLASKKISDRLKVTYRTSVGQSNAQEVLLDYRLTKKISLEGQTNQDGKSGIDLLYQLKF